MRSGVSAAGLVARERRVPLLALMFAAFSCSGLGMWALGWFIVAKLLWKLFGREEIPRTDHTVVVTAFLVGIRRSRSFKV